MSMETKKSHHYNNQQSWSLYKKFRNKKTIKNEDAWINSICFDPSEKLLGIAFCDKQLYIVDTESDTNTNLMSISLKDDINSIAFDHSGKKFAVLSYKPETLIFDIKHDKNKRIITYDSYHSFQHKEEISSIFFDENNNALGIQLDELKKKIRIIDLATNKTKISFQHNDWIKVASASQSKKYFATGSGNSKVRLFYKEQEEAIYSVEIQGSVNALAFDQSEKLLAVASRDNITYIFNLETFTKIASFPHINYISAICLGSSGKTLATASSKGEIHIFKENKK